ncbi:VanZ family protein [Burkholderia glumae]|uniref:VanZ family protein n=2 Tax=Burkholderia glumae TaxID=337 RepID=UPI002150C011|nr:VanZ family protein [Burkholderia glumae]UVS97172.1 teicoplanin resistance protein VanZ [Burkholderia glumae]
MTAGASPPRAAPHASSLGRRLFAAYAALIVYASLYPFSGWRSLGVGAFDYLFAPMPRYWTGFDVVTNVLGYLPLGVLAVGALHPRVRGPAAVLAATLFGTLVSGAMEALQTYLPTRVASNLDLGANALGALLGALLAAPAVPALIERGMLRRLRDAWFERDAATPLLLSALWPFAVLFPSPFLFGIGSWPSELWDRADVSMRAALLAWAPAGWRVAGWSDAFYALDARLSATAWEALLAALGLFAALALASLTMRREAPRQRLVIGFVAVVLVLKLAATFVQSRSGLAFDWATPGGCAGIALGLEAGLAALRLRAVWRATAAAAALTVSLVLVNVLPVNPFFDYTLSGWSQGRYLHFNGIARWLAWIWPYAALIWLAWRAERGWLGRRARGRAPGADGARGRDGAKREGR